jgi:hypothetical protein
MSCTCIPFANRCRVEKCARRRDESVIEARRAV